jgi:hypothetical protein
MAGLNFSQTPGPFHRVGRLSRRSRPSGSQAFLFLRLRTYCFRLRGRQHTAASCHSQRDPGKKWQSRLPAKKQLRGGKPRVGQKKRKLEPAVYQRR